MGSCISYENPLDFIKHIKNSYRIRAAVIGFGFFIEFIIILLSPVISLIYLLIITTVIFVTLLIINWLADIPISKGLVGLKQQSGGDVILEIIYEVPRTVMEEINKHYREGDSQIDMSKVILHKIIFPGDNIELSIRGGPNHYFLRIIKHGNILANKQCKLNGEWLSMTINIDWEISDILQLFNELKEDLSFQQELKSSTLLNQEVIPWKYFETFVTNYLQQAIIPLLRQGIAHILAKYDSSNKDGSSHTNKSLSEKIRQDISDYLSQFVIYDNWLVTNSVKIGDFYLGSMLESTAPESEDIVMNDSLFPVPGLVLPNPQTDDSRDPSILIIQRSPRDKTTIYFSDHVISHDSSISDSNQKSSSSSPVNSSGIMTTASSPVNRELTLIDPVIDGTMDL